MTSWTKTSSKKNHVRKIYPLRKDCMGRKEDNSVAPGTEVSITKSVTIPPLLWDVQSITCCWAVQLLKGHMRWGLHQQGLYTSHTKASQEPCRHLLLHHMPMSTPLPTHTAPCAHPPPTPPPTSCAVLHCSLGQGQAEEEGRGVQRLQLFLQLQ